MRNINHIEYQLISGGGRTNTGITQYLTVENGIIATATLYGGIANPAAPIGHAIKYLIYSGIATTILSKAYHNGLLGDWLRGDFCSVATTLWPFHRKKRLI